MAYTVGGNVKGYSQSGKVRQFLKKFNKQLPYGPAIQLLAIYPGEMKTYAHTKARK